MPGLSPGCTHPAQQGKAASSWYGSARAQNCLPALPGAPSRSITLRCMQRYACQEAPDCTLVSWAATLGNPMHVLHLSAQGPTALACRF